MALLIAAAVWFLVLMFNMGDPSDPMTFGFALWFVPINGLPVLILLFVADRIAIRYEASGVLFVPVFAVCSLVLFAVAAGLFWAKAGGDFSETYDLLTSPVLLNPALAAWLAYAVSGAALRPM